METKNSTAVAKETAVASKRKVLIVDDDEINRMVLEAMLSQYDYEIILAENGFEAIELFDSNTVDMILMDVMMPEMDGYEATRLIKEKCGERFVPVIFLTAITDEQALKKCIQCGGDDFLTKPFNQSILTAKIEALERVRQLHDTILTQRNDIETINTHLKQEQIVAEKVFSRIVHHGCLDIPNIDFFVSPLSVFNGDLLLASSSPAGSLNILIGDATGHGLPASISTIPVAELFYSMSEDGFGIVEMAKELNEKLKSILPTGLFFCANLINISYDQKLLTVMNAGMPDILLRRAGNSVERIISNNLPFGIVESNQFSPQSSMHSLNPGDSIITYSDGVVEAVNPAGEFFGFDRLIETVRNNQGDCGTLEAIRRAISAFSESSDQGDDTTLLVFQVDGKTLRHHHENSEISPVNQTVFDWQFDLQLEARQLKSMDPLPLIMKALSTLEQIRSHRENLYNILVELFNNALDHGILGLNSALKNHPDGFKEYFSEKSKRLKSLQQGAITIRLKHTISGENRFIEIDVTDTGGGFDADKINTHDGKSPYSGRGIKLVKYLCEHLVYEEQGRRALAKYRI